MGRQGARQHGTTESKPNESIECNSPNVKVARGTHGTISLDSAIGDPLPSFVGTSTLWYVHSVLPSPTRRPDPFHLPMRIFGSRGASEVEGRTSIRKGGRREAANIIPFGRGAPSDVGGDGVQSVLHTMDDAENTCGKEGKALESVCRNARFDRRRLEDVANAWLGGNHHGRRSTAIAL